MASIVERFNRTLKNDMWKFTHNGNYKWIDILPRLKLQTCASIELLVCISLTLAIADRFLNMVYNRVKDCRTRAI